VWLEANGFIYHLPAGLPEVTITTAYLFYEKRDVPTRLFCENKSANCSIAIVLVGFYPEKGTISAIAGLFSNARFRTGFGRDIPARVLACRISLWLKDADAQFWLVSTRIHFRYRSEAFSCPVEIFSLSRFCRISGFRTNLIIFL